MPNFCSDCGVKVPPKNKFCGECGSRLEEGKDSSTQLSDFIAYVEGRGFAVESVDLNRTFGPISPIYISLTRVCDPKWSNAQIADCEHCGNQIGEIGWNYGSNKQHKDLILCSNCLLNITRNTSVWVTPLSRDEYMENPNSILGCVVLSSGYDIRGHHIEDVRTASKFDKKLTCTDCEKNLDKVAVDSNAQITYDKIFRCSSRYSNGIMPHNRCQLCMHQKINGELVLKKLMKSSDVFQLK